MIRHLTLGLILLVSAANSIAADTKSDNISRLLLGEIMFYRYQDNNFDAISHYLHSRNSGELILNEKNDAFVASIYLNYDLHSQARDKLDLLVNNDSQSVRDMAWYYLGKLHYQNNRVKSAVDTFAKVKGTLPASEQELKHIMHGIMAINSGHYPDAINELKKIPETSEYISYVKYNLAIATIKQNKNINQLATSLKQIIESSGGSAIEAVFADQIYTMLGYVYIQNKQYEAALDEFRKVTLHGHLAARALQGMVYALTELKEYEKALNLSLRLIRMTVGNEAIHNAYVVVPFILQKLNNVNKAMGFYQHAVKYFDEQRLDLATYINRTQQGDFDEYLLDVEKIQHIDEWMQDKEMSRLFRFVATLKEWRDAVYKYDEMKHVDKRLDDWAYELLILEDDVSAKDSSSFTQLNKDIKSQKKNVQKSIRWHQKNARQFVVNALQQQLNDVIDYLGQARFALAQFYDAVEQKRLAQPEPVADIKPETAPADVTGGDDE